VLSIGKLAAGPSAGRYYVEQVAQGREDYYAGEGEAPGGWVGAGAATLGLDGEVDEGGLSRLLSAEDPVTGATLRRPLASGAVAGFDLTFRAPKSVGLLFGVAEASVAREAVRSHEAAVSGALGYLEREACRARRGAGGREQVTGEGFAAAAFRHRSSRAGDPLLHTHVVVANATRGPDGRWTALDGRELYRHAKTAGYLYQAVLRAELTERLGVEWNDVVNGAADVRGIPREVIEHFSERRAEMSSTCVAAASAPRAPRRWRRSRRAGARSTGCRWTASARTGALARSSMVWTSVRSQTSWIEEPHAIPRRRRRSRSGWKGPTVSPATARRSRGGRSCRHSPRPLTMALESRRSSQTPTRSFVAAR